MGDVCGETAVVVAVLATLKLALKVVIARGAVLVAGGLATVLDDLLHPPLFSLGGNVNGPIAVAAHIVDASGDVVALGLEHVGQVELKRRLVAAHDEQVRIALGVDAEQGTDAGAVFVGQVEAVHSPNLVVDAGLLDLKAGGVDEQVKGVLFALKDRSLGCELGDALAMGID